MIGEPSRMALRRAQRRRQLRRRRLGAAGAVVAVIAAVIVLVSSGGGRSTKGGTAGVTTTPQAGVRAAARKGSGVKASARTVSNREQAGSTTIASLAKLGLPIYCAGHHGNEVAFTFDDGPGPYTHLALKKLREAGERATFFVVGRSMNNFPGYLPQELKLAAIGDHTYTHPELTALPQSTAYSEIARTAQKIQADSGEHVQLFRPPYGLHNAAVDQIAKQLGLLEILWNVDSADSLGANYAQIITNVEAGLRPGSIVLMHENRGQTIRALTTLLPELHRRHIRSVSLPELFASDPPSTAQVREGPAGCGVAGGTHPGSGG